MTREQIADIRARAFAARDGGNTIFKCPMTRGIYCIGSECAAWHVTSLPTLDGDKLTSPGTGSCGMVASSERQSFPDPYLLPAVVKP